MHLTLHDQFTTVEQHQRGDELARFFGGNFLAGWRTPWDNVHGTFFGNLHLTMGTFSKGNKFSVAESDGKVSDQGTIGIEQPWK